MLGSNSHTISLNIILMFALVVLGGLAGILIAIYGFSPIIAALPFALIFVILTIIKPWIALAIFFLLIPLENLFVLEGDISATSSKMIGVYLVFLMIITGRLRYLADVFKHKKTLWVLGFLLAALISTIFSKYSTALFIDLLRLFIFIALYIVLILMIRDMKTLILCFQALVLGAAVSALSPLFLGIGSGGEIDLQRFGGLWGDQNVFAAILLFTMPVGLVLFLTARNSIMKIIYGSAFLIILTGFFLTYSRGGFVAFVLICLLAFYRSVRSKHRGKILAITLPIVIVFSALFYNTIADDYISRVETLRSIHKADTSTMEGSLGKRFRYYFEETPEIFKQSPLIGVGPGAFLYYNRVAPQNAHNTYFEILTGMGIVGFIPFIAILYLTWKELRKIKYISKSRGSLKLFYDYSSALEIGYIALLITGIFISIDLNKILWLSITLSTVLANILRIKISDERNKMEYSFRY